jgi:hypothetical protein
VKSVKSVVFQYPPRRTRRVSNITLPPMSVMACIPGPLTSLISLTGGDKENLAGGGLMDAQATLAIVVVC